MRSITKRESKQPRARRGVPGRAFTLLEVMLAVVIASGMMVVVLYFYQQSSRLRKDAMDEMEHIAAVRLVMDRLSSELRCAVSGSELLSGISGTSSSIEFVRLEPPVRGSFLTQESGSQSGNVKVKMQPTYKKTLYRLTSDPESQEGLSILERTEEAVDLSTSRSSVQPRTASEEGDSPENPQEEALGEEGEEEDFLPEDSQSSGTNSLPASSSDTGRTNRSSSDLLYAGDSFWGTNTALQESSGYMAMEGFVDEGTNQSQRKLSVSSVFARGIGYFNLRYYDGSQWVNSWNQKELPIGIEIRMASEDPETEEAKAAREAEAESETFETAFEEPQDAQAQGEETNAAPLLRGTDELEGIEGVEDVSSNLDTNVVVYQRIIYLPNARKKASSGGSGLGTNDVLGLDSMGESLGGEGGMR